MTERALRQAARRAGHAMLRNGHRRLPRRDRERADDHVRLAIVRPAGAGRDPRPEGVDDAHARLDRLRAGLHRPTSGRPTTRSASSASSRAACARSTACESAGTLCSGSAREAGAAGPAQHEGRRAAQHLGALRPRQRPLRRRSSTSGSSIRARTTHRPRRASRTRRRRSSTASAASSSSSRTTTWSRSAPAGAGWRSTPRRSTAAG